MTEIKDLTNEEVFSVSGGINVDNYTPRGDIWDHGKGGDAGPGGGNAATGFWYAYRQALYAMNY